MKSPFSFLWFYTLPPLIAYLTSGCSTPISRTERFQILDLDHKNIFLAYYPYLSRDQRNELLATEEKPSELIERWSKELKDPDHILGSFEEMTTNPIHRRVSKLDIKTDATEIVTEGHRIVARAYATYQSGKVTDITSDTEWSVEPHLAKLNGNEIDFDCVHSDLTLTAHFLGERDASQAISIQKPLKSLEIRVKEASLGADRSLSFQLSAFAQCQDGSISDVSCQTTWRAVSELGRIQGCGNLVVNAKEKRALDSLTVRAQYGGFVAQKTLNPPIR